MAKARNLNLVFPLGGLHRRASSRQQPPYTTVSCVNVRPFDVASAQERGGSRPGLTKVSASNLGAIVGLFPLTYLDGSGVRRHDLIYVGAGSLGRVRGSTATATDGVLQTAEGVPILVGPDDEEIIFASTVTASSPVTSTGAYNAAAHNGKLYLADSVLRAYDPVTGVVVNVAATAGTIPTAQPLVCMYRDRIFLAGTNHLWYASRQGDPTDWNFGANPEDPGRAVAGAVAAAGLVGDVPKALIPVRDGALVFACENSLWVLRGDPATGTMRQVSGDVGMIAPDAWAQSPDGLIAFLSNDGVYLWGAGSDQAPTRLSEERLPEELREVSVTSNTVTMAWDSVGRGFHLFITPTTATLGEHWWIDVTRKTFWPVAFATGHQPTAIARIEPGGLSEVVLGCKDGYLRKFDVSAATDDSTAFQSHVVAGPVRLASSDVQDAILTELHGTIASITSSSVTWRLVVGSSAEAVAAAATAGVAAVLAGSTPTGVFTSGTWTSGRNRVSRPRARGAWVAVWLSSAGKWAYESAALVAEQLGRLR